MNTTEITSKTHNIYNAIIDADAIQYEGNVVELDYCNEPTGDADNEVLYFKWSDSMGHNYSVKITEEGIEESFVDPSSITELILIDNEGDEFPITILKRSPVTNLVYEGEGGKNKRA